MDTKTEIKQYLTFSLVDEDYALEVFKVREVLELIKITRVPRMPTFMLGVINLRGSVVPVVDLRLKLGLDAPEATQDSSIIILEISVGEEVLLLGIYVDSVHEVVDFDGEDLEPAPKIGSKIQSDFIRGVGKRNDEFVMILDLDRVFGEIEATSLPVSGTEDPDGE
jgi:purine-binding chemotaxis protein CheW